MNAPKIEPLDITTAAPPQIEYLNRESAAHRLGISVPEFRRRQRLGEFKPIKRGQNNELLFSSLQIDEARAAAKNAQPTLSAEYTNEQAADVFAALASGKTAIQCVVELKVPPRSVNALLQDYAALTECIFLPKETVEWFNRQEFDGPMPIRNASDFVQVVKAIVTALNAKCMECKKRPRHLCKSCVQAALNSLKKEQDGI